MILTRELDPTQAGSELDGWRHCPRCAGALERWAESVACATCGLVVYAKPAPAVCAFVLDDEGRVLLGRRARPPAAGLWDALGGFVHEGEQPLDALRRELMEETGTEIAPLTFVGAFADRYGDGGGFTLNLYWTARVVAGRLRPADDVAELRWFPPDALPDRAGLAFANTAEALAAWRTLPGDRRQDRNHGLFEIQLVAMDLEPLACFYRETVGLEISIWDIARGRVHFRLGRGQLILAQAESEPASPGWPGLPPPLLIKADPHGPTPIRHGPVHFAIEVPPGRLVGEGERLRAEGRDVRGPFRWPDGFRSIYFRDPEGNVVELIAR